MPLLNPYLQHLASRRRLCPECLEGTAVVLPSLDPNTGYEACTRCGRVATVTSPAAARVGWPANDPREVAAATVALCPPDAPRESFLHGIRRRLILEYGESPRSPRPKGRIIRAGFASR